MSEEISIENLFKDSTAREDLAIDNEISINKLFGVEEQPIELQTDKKFIFENKDINEPIEDKDSRIKELKSQLEVEDKELFVPLNELKKDKQKKLNDRFVKIKELQELTNSPELQELESIVKFDEEEKAVPKLRKLYSEFGLRFEETGLGDAMKVYTDKDKDGITIDLDTFTYKGAEEEVKKLKDYISNNKTDFDKTTTSKLKNAKGNPTAFLNLYNEEVIKEENEKIKSNLNYFDQELNKLNTEQKDFNEQIVKFEYEVDKGLITKEQAAKTQKDLIVKQNELNSKRSGLKSYFEKDIQGLASDINSIQAEQTSILADRGTWVESWYNTVLDVPDLLNRVSVDVTNVIKDGVVDIKKYTGLIDSNEAEKQRAKNELEKNIRNEFSIKDEIGSDITNEYQQKFQETTFGAVSTSIVQMLGSSLIVPGTGPAAFGTIMGGQEAGRILEEMDAPAFNDVPDWQKVAFASSVGVAVSKLEKIGASAIIGKNPLAKRIVLNVLKKQGGKKVASGTIKDIIEQTIENKFLRGGFAVGVGGGMEGVTEVAQEVTEVGLKNAFNEVKNVFIEDDKEFFTKEQTEINKDNLLQAFKVGALAGGAFGTMNAFVEASNRKVVDQLNEEQYKRARAFYTDPQSLKNYNTKIRVEYAKGNIAKDQLRNEERSLRELGGIFREIRKSTRLTTEGEKRVFSLIQQKKALQKQIDEADDKSLVAKQKESISEINSQIESVIKDPTYDFDKSFTRLKEVTKVEAEESGKEFKVLDDTNFNKELSNLGLDESSYKGSTGYIHTDGNIYINETVAENLREIPVTSHELLHGILNKQLSNKTKEQSERIVKDFKNKLNNSQRQAVNQRLQEAYGKSEDDATSQEWFTALSDGIVNNEVAFEESGFQSLGRLLTNVFLKPFGYKNASFKTGKQAFNFVRDYAKQSKAIAEGKQQAFEGQIGEIVSEGVEAGIEGARSIQVEGVDPGQVQTMINKVANRAAAKYFSGIPENIRQEAGLTRRSYIDSAKSELAGIAEKFDASRAEFDRYMANTGMQRLNSLASRLGVKSAEDQTTRITEDTKQIAAEEEASRDVRTEREVRQAERKGIKVREKLPKVYDVDKVVKSIRSKAKSLKAKNIKQLKGTALEEVSTMIGRDEELGKSIFRKISKNADLNKPEMLAVQKFINSNIDIAKGSLLEGYTSEFKATGIVNKLLEKFYNKRSVRAKTGPGLKVQIKKPNISDIEFKEAFGIIGKDQANWNQKVVANKGGVSDILKGFVRNFDQVISSQEVREQLIEDGEVEQALMTLKDGMPSGFFSKSADKLYAAENLGKTFNKLNEDQKSTYLANLPMFIELLSTKGITPDTAFRLAYDTFLYNKKGTKPLSLRIDIINSWKDIVNQAPKTLYDAKKPDKFQLNEYLHRSFDEQTDVDSIKENLGISKEGINFREEDQILGYLSLMSDYFGDLKQEFDNDAEFFQYVVQHFEQTFTSAAKIGGLPNHAWKQTDGKWELVEGKKSGRGSDLRFGLFNNKTEFFNILLKPFDTGSKLKIVDNKLVYDGEKIVTKRAPQSTAAKNKYLKEFIKNGKLSNESLLLSYNDATRNQDAIIKELKWYKDNQAKDVKDKTKANITTNDLGMFLAASVGDMTAILRSAYAIDSVALSDSKNSADYTYEHNPPVKVMQNYMSQFVNGDITETELRQKFKDASTSVIPELMDTAINIRYKSSIPQNSTSRFDRYYNPTTYGKFPFEMTVYTPQFDKEGNVTSFKKSVKGEYLRKAYQDEQAAIKANKQEAGDSKIIDTKNMTNEQIIGQFSKADEALKFARDPNTPVKKIRVFDFDDTLATTKSDVLFTAPDGTKGKLNAEEFAKQGKDLLDEGYVFDFSEFNKVTKGKPGPLLEVAKKIQAARGTEDVFVLTARAAEAQPAIKEFLDGVGLNIPLKNITGLGNSTGEAKANWLVNKAAEGYNDFYFADDAYQNVKAVKDAMSVLDVKSKVQQAKGQFSKNINEDFNKIIEQTTGIASEKRYSEAKAKVRGANKGNKKFFIPYSAEDFMGLIYPLLSKGNLGDSQMAWFKEHLLDPYARAQENLSTDRIQLMQDFKALKKALNVPKDLRKKTDSGFTKEQAVRVYLFNKAGFDVPGISKTDLNELLDLVNSDSVLKTFGDQIFNITKGDSYAKPGENWLVGTITTDLIDILNTVKRAKYLEQSGYNANAELIFNKENLNKLEASYGSKYREAMENILGRMKSGKNRIFSGNRLSNRVLDYINNSTGAIMFFNTRSAVLQTISSINFLNWSFNNPIKAGAAFANQPQYWKDFVELINSDYLVDRRNGLKLNINESEIADAAATSKNKAKAAINYILQKGFLPTQYADSFAIASGGATFYRNRIDDLVKNQSMSEVDAKKQAMLEWRETAEISQQSSDPSKISAQQASDLGRVILAFANTPMQYARIQKRAVQDLIKGRGDSKTHVSKIIYYAVVQNLIFNALQSALFGLGFGDDEDDEKKEEMYLRTANGMLDSQLRGLGLAGATVAVIKNFLADIYERSGRSRPEYVDSVYELLRVSPPISNKISKIRGAAWQFDSKKRRKEIFDKGFSIDNPAYEAGAKVISATTNIPLDRVYSKVNNISGAMDEDAETWQTVAMLAGWPKWTIMPKEKSSQELPKFPGRKIKKFKKYDYKKKTKKGEKRKFGY
tara:strand:+ start:570 stop:8564 length:7995 start_codon:yes stop_codon:yes gene_type:complete